MYNLDFTRFEDLDNNNQTMEALFIFDDDNPISDDEIKAKIKETYPNITITGGTYFAVTNINELFKLNLEQRILDKLARFTITETSAVSLEALNGFYSVVQIPDRWS